MSPKTEVIQDVFAMAVPEGVDPADPDLVPKLEALARAYVVRQYQVAPKALLFDTIDWLVTAEPADVEKFQPAHDCAACRAGNDQSLAFLRQNPGRYVALGNLTYTEVWA